MIKVAYDVSILGQGYINPKARTGIFRVVESLMLELKHKDDLEIFLITLNQEANILDQLSTSLYLENLYPSLKYDLIHAYSSQLKLDFLYQKIVELEALLAQKSEDNILIYKFVRILDKLAIKLSRIEVKINNSSEVDIYHCLYFPFSDDQFRKSQRILMIYDLIPLFFKEWVTDKVYYRFLNTLNKINYNQDWIVCISEQTKKDFCEYTQMNPDRVFVTPLAASNNFYPVNNFNLIKKTLKRYKIDESPYFLSLCTLEPRKNLNFLIKCFSKLIIENPTLDINLVLVGVSGWKNKTIFMEAQSSTLLKSRVMFTGYVPDQDLSAIYSGALAFVYPSLYEGFGLPPLEAMQCGTPVITSNTSSLPEVVGDAGIMIDPTQEDELCHALLNIVNDSNLRKTLSTKGLERSSQFSWAKCAEETANIYRLAVEHKK